MDTRRFTQSGLLNALIPVGCVLAAICCQPPLAGGAAVTRQQAAIARLDDDGMLIVGGRRTFIFGCYWNPGTSQGLAQLRRAGFNLVSAEAKRDALDEIARHGLMAWIPLGERIAPANDAEQKALENLVRPLLDHPALAAWEIPDEVLWNEWFLRHGKIEAERAKLRDLAREREKSGADISRVRALMAEEAILWSRADFAGAETCDREIRKLLGAPAPDPTIQMSAVPQSAEQLRQRLLRGYGAIRRLDQRPVWMNFAPRNTIEDMRRYAEAADIVGCDIYPVPVTPPQDHSDLANRRLSCVGDYTERFRQVGGKRAVWMVLQGFGWRDLNKPPADAPKDTGRRPTRAETRFMLYDAIVHRARAVLYWGCNYAQEPPDLWRELCAVVREAADLGEIWAARDAEQQPTISFAPTWGSVDHPPVAMAKSHEGKTHVLIVNEHYNGLAVRLSGLVGADGSRASLVGDPGGCALAGDRVVQGSLVVHMPGQSVAIVAIAGR